MAYHAGKIVYLDYGEGPPQVFHTRLVLGHVQGTKHLIRTPDGDVYVEQLDNANPDLVGFYEGPDDGTLPPGVPAANVYGFRAMTLAEFNQYLAEGRTELVAELCLCRQSKARMFGCLQNTFLDIPLVNR